MFEAIFYVTVCSGWLCKALHGDETVIETHHRYATHEACVALSEMAAQMAIPAEFPYRIACKQVATR